MKKGIIRSISYTFNFSTVFRRQVGKTMEINTKDGLSKIKINKIEVDDSYQIIPMYLIYGENENGESGLWKCESCVNMQVEYDLADLLTPCDQ